MGVDYDKWPMDVIITWRCERCSLVIKSLFREEEPGDGDYDSFNFTCLCGAYYKKLWRVPEHCRISREEITLPKKPPCPDCKGVVFISHPCEKHKVFVVPIEE